MMFFLFCGFQKDDLMAKKTPEEIVIFKGLIHSKTGKMNLVENNFYVLLFISYFFNLRYIFSAAWVFYITQV